jgi:heat shock protein HslJ
MKKLLILFVLILSTGGCSSVKDIQKKHLNGSWVMKSMNGVSLNKDNFKRGLPVFNFDLSKSTFSGDAGCNLLSSSITVADSTIKFGEIMSTKMACPDNEIEGKVIRILDGNTLRYKIHDGKMILTSPDGNEMHFILKLND